MPAGTSTKNMIHSGQLISPGNFYSTFISELNYNIALLRVYILHLNNYIWILGHFDQFDYGEEQNLIIYNQATPPHYDFSRIRIPIRFYHGDNDIIANPLVSWIYFSLFQSLVVFVN